MKDCYSGKNIFTIDRTSRQINKDLKYRFKTVWKNEMYRDKTR